MSDQGDILRTLRTLQVVYDKGVLPATSRAYGEAADEIERLRAERDKIADACVVVVQERDALQKQCEARAIAMRDHADKIETDQIHQLRNQLVNAERRFESIRLILIKHLEEPERTAFWLAVEGRNAISSSQPDDQGTKS